MIRDKLNLYEELDYFYSKCFLCDSTQHNSTNCPKYHFVPHKNLVLLEHIHSPTQKRNGNFKRYRKNKIKALLNMPNLIKGVNLLMNKKEFDDFFESYDAIFEKEMEKIIESGYLDDSDSKN